MLFFSLEWITGMAILLSRPLGSSALNNGLAKTPPLGFNGYNVFSYVGLFQNITIQIANHVTKL